MSIELLTKIIEILVLFCFLKWGSLVERLPSICETLGSVSLTIQIIMFIR